MALAVAGLDAWLWWSARRGIRPTQALPALRLFVHEVRALADLWRLGRGRVVVPEGAVALPARRGWWQLPAMLTVAMVIEIVAVELLVPWPLARLLLLIASLYSIPLLWGYLAGRIVHPHYLGADLVLREGRRELLRVPADEIVAVRAVRGFAAERGGVGKQLVLGGPEGTNVEIRLADGRSVALWLDEGAGALPDVTP